ncbi:MAG: hypothetical protein GY951_09290 [Psychromonas sp.]|nr:hypothetical protein [Psychromonas sp.]
MDVKVLYESTQATGPAFNSPIIGKSIGVVETSTYIVANIPDNSDDKSSSRIYMDLSYFDNGYNYVYAELDKKQIKLKSTILTKRICIETCQFTQGFSFPVATQVLRNAIETGLEYKLTDNVGNSPVTFLIPGHYIEGLLLASSKSLKSRKVVAVPSVVTEPTLNTEKQALQMSQELFAKASDTEKEQFTDWAFENRKSIETPLDGKGKILPMLEYWYEKATSDEKAEILTWILAL